MGRPLRLASACAVALALIGCTGDAPPDAGSDAALAHDAGDLDGGDLDGGDLDGGGADASHHHPLDADALDADAHDAHVHDAALPDATHLHDAQPADAPTEDAGPPVLHGCRTFVDRSALDADRTVRFDSSPSLAYDPPCMRVAPGEAVAFEGPFDRHPLAPGRAPGRDLEPAGSEPNPIPPTETGARVEVTFPLAGSFPYYCTLHGAWGMVGVVLVE